MFCCFVVFMYMLYVVLGNRRTGTGFISCGVGFCRFSNESLEAGTYHAAVPGTGSFLQVCRFVAPNLAKKDAPTRA